jgi:hypothetical protein
MEMVSLAFITSHGRYDHNRRVDIAQDELATCRRMRFFDFGCNSALPKGESMTPDAFRHSLRERLPPKAIPPPLRALWWAAKGDWNKAHEIAQSDDGADAAWVHAYLHRAEGDLANAHYWYTRAGSQPPTTSTEAEWDAIVETLLADAE